MDLNKYWKQLHEFDKCVRHDYYFFIILDRSWDNHVGDARLLNYDFFLRPNVYGKELNLWI